MRVVIKASDVQCSSCAHCCRSSSPRSGVLSSEPVESSTVGCRMTFLQCGAHCHLTSRSCRTCLPHTHQDVCRRCRGGLICRRLPTRRSGSPESSPGSAPLLLSAGEVPQGLSSLGDWWLLGLCMPSAEPGRLRKPLTAGLAPVAPFLIGLRCRLPCPSCGGCPAAPMSHRLNNRSTCSPAHAIGIENMLATRNIL